MYKKYEIAESYSEHIYFVADTDNARYSLVKEDKLRGGEIKPRVILLNMVETIKLQKALNETIYEVCNGTKSYRVQS